MKIFSKKVAAIIAVSAVAFSAASFNASASEVNSESYVTVADSDDWDSVLDSYEKFVNQYIKTLEKAKAGDATALASYAKLLKKAQDLQTKLDNASDEMTEEQLARYSKLSLKLANAVQNAM